jgi:hypothetical protein
MEEGPTLDNYDPADRVRRLKSKPMWGGQWDYVGWTVGLIIDHIRGDNSLIPSQWDYVDICYM